MLPQITLNNGVEMPLIGMGTAHLPEAQFQALFEKAYSLGYKNFDTAHDYGTEPLIARAIKNSDIKREDIFITTKVHANSLYWGKYQYGRKKIFNVRNFTSIRNAILKSFHNLHTDYIDLFLVHWPWPMYLEMYKQLTQLYKEGRIRAIGVSSFTIGHLESLREVSDIVPAVNQIEMSPLNTQKKLIEYCREHGIRVEAMATFSHKHSADPRLEIFNNPMLVEIAKRHNKSVVQVVLRWQIQQEIIIIPRSINHLEDNIDIVDFELSEEEMELIDSLDQGKCLNYNPYTEECLSAIPPKYRGLSIK